MKKKHKAIILFLPLFLLIFCLLNCPINDDLNFGYRRLIDMNPGTLAGEDYSIQLKIGQSALSPSCDFHLNGFSSPDFTDIRFTGDDGITQLDYWIENIEGSSPARIATYWVEIKDNCNNQTHFYIYYGCTDADYTGDANNIFPFFDDFEEEFDISEQAFVNPTQPLITPTYDGSGQATHPDILYFSQPWNGYHYWMAMTPYPGSNDQYENPSVLGSNDGITWVVPAGLANPLIGAPPCDHNCDADIIYNRQTDELWLYYLDTRRASRCTSHVSQPYYNHNYLQLFTSPDGINWTGPVTVIDWDLDTEPLWLSPSIVQLLNNYFLMWVSNGSNQLVSYDSPDGVNWSGPYPAQINQGIWHLDVNYIPERAQFWMLSVYPSSEGTLVWSHSGNGETWITEEKPVLTINPSSWDANLYRGCFVYKAPQDTLHIWYSAYELNPTEWHIGYVEDNYSQFIDTIDNHSGGWTVVQEAGNWSSSSALSYNGQRSGRLQQSSSVPTEKMRVCQSVDLQNNCYLQWYLYDDGDPSAMKLVRLNGGFAADQVGLGVWTGASTVNYVFHNTNYEYYTTAVPRSLGWHTFGIQFHSDLSLSFYIDDQKIGELPHQFDVVNSISIEGYYGGPTIFYVDDIILRKKALIEPVIQSVSAVESGNWTL